MIAIEDKKVYSALLKCNKIGKSLMDKSEYCMVNGMMVTYPIGEDSEKYSEYDYGVHTAFIHDKTLKALGDLAYLPLKIEGDMLYSIDKRTDLSFLRMEITDESLSIIYKLTTVECEDSILIKFWDKYLGEIDPTYEPHELSLVIDINVIQDYKSFISVYIPEVVESEYHHVIPLLIWGVNDGMFQSSLKYTNTILDELDSSNMQQQLFDGEMISELMEATQPILFTFEFPDRTHKFRAMKVLVKGYTKPDNLGMEIMSVPWNIGNMYQNIIVVRQKEFTICSAYKSIIY
jgi:hypothetical protein